MPLLFAVTYRQRSRPQHLLEPPEEVDGLRIAGLSDLMAMKLKVVGDRGELRDYFDDFWSEALAAFKALAEDERRTT